MHGPANGPFYAIYYPFLAAVGVPANLVAIIILSRGRCGLSLCITYYLLAIAVTDALVIIAAVILNRIGGIYFRYSVLSTTPGCTVSSVLVYTTRDGSVWLTVAFTIDRFVAIGCHSLKTMYCTEKTALLVILVVCAMSCLKNVPFFFTYQPLYILEGVPWFCNIIAPFYTSPFWQTYLWLDRILTPFLPFFLIMLLNALTIRHILVASRARKRLCSGEKRGDSEMANHKKSIVLLFAISFSFMLLWVTYVAHFFYVQITGEAYFTGLDFNDPQYIFQETTNMLQLLSSCTNIFIYAVTQTKFREDLKYLLMHPLVKIIGSFKK